jgi:hypothetical protein
MNNKYYTHWRGLEDDDYLLNIMNNLDDNLLNRINSNDIWQLNNTKHYRMVINYLYNTSVFNEEYSRVWYGIHNTTSFELRTVCALWFFSLILQIVYWNLLNLNVLNLTFRQYNNIIDIWNFYYLFHLTCLPITLYMKEHVWFGGVISLLLDYTFIYQYLVIPRLNKTMRLLIWINIVWLMQYNYFVFSLK